MGLMLMSAQLSSPIFDLPTIRVTANPTPVRTMQKATRKRTVAAKKLEDAEASHHVGTDVAGVEAALLQPMTAKLRTMPRCIIQLSVAFQ